MLTHGSLFSGIGGFDLGFERAGIKTVWQVEIDAYCRGVLARHFPDAARFSDIREVNCNVLPPVDIISGGFPCQDISNAGKRAGIDGERSGLWSEYARIIRGLRPRYVVVENVAALLGRGMERVLADLAACGYDAEWQSIRASDVGAPHRRERIWIVAYPQRSGVREQSIFGSECHGASVSLYDRETIPHAARGRTRPVPAGSWPEGEGTGDVDGHREDVAYAESERWNRRPVVFAAKDSRGWSRFEQDDWWAVEPDVGRVAHGVSSRVDRLRGLGNAIVPQIAEFIGRQIVRVA
jgi:DNA (cytosine-5)-methyltransferase 1